MENFKFGDIVKSLKNNKEYAIGSQRSENRVDVSLVKNGKTWGTHYTKDVSEFEATGKNVAHWENGVLIPANV